MKVSRRCGAGKGVGEFGTDDPGRSQELINEGRPPIPTESGPPPKSLEGGTCQFAFVGLIAFLVLAVAGCGGSLTEAERSELNRQLVSAAWDNDVTRARELIAEGADVNYKDETVQSAYLIATSEGYLELLELTLDNGADVSSLDSFNGTGLIRAAERGHSEIVERLLATEIAVNHVNNLGWTALHEAIILGDGSERYVRTIQLLLDHGADPALATGDGQTPVALARGHGQPAVAELLQAAL